MTMIDPASRWFEIASTTKPDSYCTNKAFDFYWLIQYLRSKEKEFNNKNEFKRLFYKVYNNYGLNRKPITDYNPVANAIIEHVHQVLGKHLI